MHPRLLLVLVWVAVPLFAQGTITSLSPSSTGFGGPMFTLTVNGSGFNILNLVQWDGANLPTSIVSANQLTATVSASLIASLGSHTVRVRASSALPLFSNSVTFNVVNPVPVMGSISPSSAIGAGPGFTMTVTGSSFLASSVVTWDLAALTTTFVSSTSLTAQVPASLLLSVGPALVKVQTPAPGGGFSNAATFTVNPNPQPTLSNVSPSTVTMGSNGFLMIFTGTNFNQSTIARLGGVDLATTFVNPTSVHGLVLSSLLTTPGQFSREVFNPAPGGGTATFGSLTVNNSLPAVTSVTPATVEAGVGFTLTVNGSNFNPTSVVRFNGNPLPTTLMSSTQLTAGVLGALVPVAPATHTITVNNPPPGGGSSAGAPINVVNPAPSVTSLNTPNGLPGGATTQNLLVTGSGFVPTTTFTCAGVPLPAQYDSPTSFFVDIPPFMLRSTAAVVVVATNPPPGGGTGFIATDVIGPEIIAHSPSLVPVMTAGSPPLTLALVGGPSVSAFHVADVIRINGAPQATTKAGNTLSCQIDGTIAAALQPGGFEVTVTRNGTVAPVVSNAVTIFVGSPAHPANSGTVTLVPVPPGPGQLFNIRATIPLVGVPITLIAEAPAPPTFVLNLGSGFSLLIGPGLNSPVVLADGLGIFGPPDGATTVLQTMPSGGNTDGIFQILNLTAPPALGITVSLAAIYPNPISPVGAGATFVSGPYTL